MTAQDVKIINHQLLHAIRWSGSDLELTFTKNDEDLSTSGIVIRVSNAVGVSVNLEFRNQSGMGLVWDATTTPQPNGVGLSIDFAGAPIGSISASGTRLDIFSYEK